MSRSRKIFLASSIVLALIPGWPKAAEPSQMMTLQMPATADPAHVALNSKTTALLLLDYVEDICNSQPTCRGPMLAAMAPFMSKARAAGLVVAYGTRAQNMTKWLQNVAPTSGDIKVANTAQDRFYGTDLDKELKAKGVKTLIIVGWKISGSVTYTSVGAMARDYTVVIPMDTTSASSDYETSIGFYNVLNSGNANLANEPLKPKAVTLTRTDMIDFR